MKIQVLYFDGCPNDQATRTLVERMLAEEGLTETVEMVLVETREAAEPHRFLGSPTVQIDGVDIEVARRNDTRYAMACRTYRSSEGASGVPPTEMIRAAIRSNIEGPDQGETQ